MDADNDIADAIADATFDFTMGDHATAIAKLRAVTEAHPKSGEAWHSLAEVLLADRQMDEALKAADCALQVIPEDVHVNVSLSRIWVELGDKAKAEHYGAQARMLGWKAALQEPPPAE